MHDGQDLINETGPKANFEVSYCYEAFEADTGSRGRRRGGVSYQAHRSERAPGQSECAACRCPRAAAACRYRSLLVLTTNVNKCEMTIDRQL